MLYSYLYIFLWGRTADYAEDGSGSGIVGLLVVFVLIYLFNEIWPSKEKEDNHYNRRDSYQQAEDSFDDLEELEQSQEYYDNDIFDDFEFGNSHSSQPISKPQLDDNGEVIITGSMREECIKIYGDYGEFVGIKDGGISIKEDGEYRIILKNDWRFDILQSYIKKYKPERYLSAEKVADKKLVMIYSENTDIIFPPAKPIERHGFLSKQYLGGLIIALMAYKWQPKYYVVPDEYSKISETDFLLSIGFDKALYICKYIGQPMDLNAYYIFRNMSIKKITLREYRKIEEEYGMYKKEYNGFYTRNGKYIGKNQSDVDKYMQELIPLSWDRAVKECNAINWHI